MKTKSFSDKPYYIIKDKLKYAEKGSFLALVIQLEAVIAS